MNLQDIHPGKYYKVRDYGITPASWNQQGHMNRYFGRTVKIKDVNDIMIVIEQDKGDQRTWFFNACDFTHEDHSILEDELFEI